MKLIDNMLLNDNLTDSKLTYLLLPEKLQDKLSERRKCLWDRIYERALIDAANKDWSSSKTYLITIDNINQRLRESGAKRQIKTMGNVFEARGIIEVWFTRDGRFEAMHTLQDNVPFDRSWWDLAEEGSEEPIEDGSKEPNEGLSNAEGDSEALCVDECGESERKERAG